MLNPCLQLNCDRSLLFQVVFFTNSGTEANELAMMMARLYTGRHDIISLRNAYHGNAAATMGTTGQSIWKFNVVQVQLLILHIANPLCRLYELPSKCPMQNKFS